MTKFDRNTVIAVAIASVLFMLAMIGLWQEGSLASRKMMGYLILLAALSWFFAAWGFAIADFVRWMRGTPSAQKKAAKVARASK